MTIASTGSAEAPLITDILTEEDARALAECQAAIFRAPATTNQDDDDDDDEYEAAKAQFRAAVREHEDSKLALSALEGSLDQDALHQARKRVVAAEGQLKWLKGASMSGTLADYANTPGAQAPIDYENFVDRTEAGNAQLLVAIAGGDLRYVHETGEWIRWDGRRWHVDTYESFATGYAKRVAAFYYKAAEDAVKNAKWSHDLDGQIVPPQDFRKWAQKSRSRTAIANMLDLARKAPGVAISVRDLDKNPWLLGVKNGVVDLRNGRLHKQEAREDFITKRCPIRYNPRANAPRWTEVIAQATGLPIPAERDAHGNVIASTVGRYTPRPEYAHYLQKALGYALTGITREHKFFVGIGEGSNSKGVIFDTIKAILGPYAVTVPASLFMLAKYDADAERPTALAATLAGARLAVASEVREGQHLNAATIKAHTGDAEQTARRMRENPFTFTQTHKVFLLTNVQPALDHIDPAMRGRLHCLPFDRRWNRPGEIDRDPALPDGDKDLTTTLKGEYEGILAWLVYGAMLYDDEGLTPPDEVVATTGGYLRAQDHLGQWLATMERCEARRGTRGSQLFSLFTQWCVTEGCKPEPATQTAFGRSLRSRGIETVQRSDGNYWGLVPGVEPRFAALVPPPPNRSGGRPNE